MAYDESLAERVRQELKNQPKLVEKKMFGGLCFMSRGNMVCGIVGDELMLRLGKEGGAAALKEPNTRVMDFTGKPLSGFVLVEPDGIARQEQLWAWLRQAVEFVETLPEK